ncbi:TRAP transporter small permease [Acidovorax sp. MR-S7]|uniref:TRAP transporter small permease n=1 Tax=Acidovorax sp. MR-S7 TaxID=1268622 RepID=UPI000375D1C8|nr:TRAP transporter small permease [Acidovorax sp. MR-S7]GAD23823.1 tripartite ATP-independent periplasmic transporter, DctQ component [Acidovorax sp. MR-S7]
MRRWLDGLYSASAWVAGLFMIGVLAMVLLTIVSRLFGFHAPGSDAYAGYAMAGAGFMALASTLKAGEHIRVTLLLGALKGGAHKALEVACLVIATLLSGFLAFYSARLVWQSWEIDDISVGIDATPLWIPQIFMALGTLVFFIAFCDELVLELRGQRKPRDIEDAHHE